MSIDDSYFFCFLYQIIGSALTIRQLKRSDTHGETERVGAKQCKENAKEMQEMEAMEEMQRNARMLDAICQVGHRRST